MMTEHSHQHLESSLTVVSDSSWSQKGEDPQILKKNVQDVQRVTWLAMIANFFLSLLKFFAGIWGNSQVLVADAVHSFSDLATDLAVLIGVRFWGRPADKEHPHGHAKIEALVTLFIGFILALVGIELIKNAIETLEGIIRQDKTVEIELPKAIALIAALISIIVKEFLYRITVKIGLKVRSAAVIANAWHHRSDAISSIPALLAVGFCMFLGPDFAFLDPVGTVVVGCMILYVAFEIVRPTFGTLLDRGESLDVLEKIKEIVLNQEGICGVHKIRTRPLGSSRFAVDLHIQVDGNMTVQDSHSLSHHLQKVLCEKNLKIVDVIVHVEPF